jgi:DNA-binding HxlR family transcriptional regulator
MAGEPETTTVPDDSDEVPDDVQCLCPLGGVMDLLARKNAMQVVCVVGALQPVRYGEIEDAFGEVSSSTLSARLEELVETGLLDRERYAEIPPRVEYSLTEEGEELSELLEPLLEWVEGRKEHDK